MSRAVFDGKHKLSYWGPILAGQGKPTSLKDIPLIFAPETDDQDKLQMRFLKDKVEACFYTVGMVKPDRFRGPAYIYDVQPRNALPLSALMAEFTKIGNNPATQYAGFRKGDWRFFVRPVNATKQACLNCHNGELKGKEQFTLNHPLGALVIGIKERNP